MQIITKLWISFQTYIHLLHGTIHFLHKLHRSTAISDTNFAKACFTRKSHFYSIHTVPEPVDTDTYLDNSHEYTQVHVQYSYIAMLHGLYVLLFKLQFSIYKHIILLYYCENTHLLRYRSEHTCASAIIYQVDSVTKSVHCKP